MCKLRKRDTIETLLDYQTSTQELGVDFNIKDHNGDSPLTLLCMRGYANDEAIQDRAELNKQRARLVDELLPHVRPEAMSQPGSNNALHWCVYNGDRASGLAVFRRAPRLLLEKNQFEETPLKQLVSRKVKVSALDEAKRLMRSVCEDFQRILEDSVSKAMLHEAEIDADMHATLDELAMNVERARDRDEFDSQKSDNRVYVYSKRNSLMRNDFVIFLHELLIGSIIIDLPELAFFLTDRLGVSPFYRGNGEKSALHHASESPNPGVLRRVLEMEYFYLDKQTLVDIPRKVLKERQTDGNIGLHFAALRGNLQNFRALTDVNQSGLEVLNQRILRPPDCNRDDAFKSWAQFEKQTFDDAMERDHDRLIKPDSCSRELIDKAPHSHLYVIVCRDQQADPQRTLVFNQLLRVNQLKPTNRTARKSRFLSRESKQAALVASGLRVYEDNLVIGDEQHSEDEMFLGGGGLDKPIEDFESIRAEREIYESPEFDGELLRVKWIELADYDVPKRGFYRHCYLVGLNRSGQDEIANCLNLKVYNKLKKMPDYFQHKHRHRFEHFRDSHLQRMMLFLLDKEFDMEYYTSRGIVDTHFFLHSPPQNAAIPGRFFANYRGLIRDNLVPRPSRVNLLNGTSELNYYFGPNLGLYMGFSNLYSSWLILLSVIGIVFFVLIYVLGDGELDFEGLPIFAILIILIVTLVDQFWERRENELVYLWDLRAYTTNEAQRKQHHGKWVIDAVTRRPRKKNRMTTFHRRLITELPVLLLGLFFIIGNYVLFMVLNGRIAEGRQSGVYTDSQVRYYGMLLGAGNGVSISVLNKVYQLVVEGVLVWENHRYESTLKSSRVPKLFLFNFCMHYINLFYYAFYLQDFLVLRANFITLFITRAVTNLGLSYVLPIALFWFKKKMHRKRLETEWARRKGAFLAQNVMSNEWYFDLSEPIQRETKSHEAELYLWHQVEHSLLRPPPLDLTLIWMNQLLQFGFIVFFGVVFPLAPLIGLAFNLLDAYLLCYCSAVVNRRSKIIMLPNAGVWTYIVTVMTYIALVTNAALFAFVSQGLRTLLKDSQRYNVLLTLVMAEHVVLLLKICLSFLISNVPLWVKEAIKKRKKKRQMYLQSQNQFEIVNKIKENIKKSSLFHKGPNAPVQTDVNEFNQMMQGVANQQVHRRVASEVEVVELKTLNPMLVEEGQFDLQTEEELENALMFGSKPPAPAK